MFASLDRSAFSLKLYDPVITVSPSRLIIADFGLSADVTNCHFGPHDDGLSESTNPFFFCTLKLIAKSFTMKQRVSTTSHFWECGPYAKALLGGCPLALPTILPYYSYPIYQ
jgi:hypothetical protein